jgi:hypothetical protein
LDRLFGRAIKEGGLAWDGEGPYQTKKEAPQALEAGLTRFTEAKGLK